MGKKMARMPRIHIEEGLYYIIVKGSSKEHLFKDDSDCQQYLELLEKYKAQHQFRLFAYFLITDSIELFMQTGPGITISEIMRDLSTNYTKYFNGRHEKSGHLFQSRFKAVLVQKDRYLKEATRYIHCAPAIEGVVEDPAAYNWSSYPAYLGMAGQYGLPPIVDSGEVLEQFSADPKQQVDLYRKFVGSAGEAELNAFKRKLEGSQILGTEAYAREIRQGLKAAAKKDEPRVLLRNNILFITAGSIVIVILGFVLVHSYRINVRFRESLGVTLKQKEAKYKEELSRQRDLIEQDLEEKYKADEISFKAMSKRLEIEKERTEQLERKIKELQ